MPNFTDLSGLAGVALAVTASVLLLPGMENLARARRTLLLAAVFVLLLIPAGTLPLAAYVRGMTGDLSITTLVLLCSALLRPWCSCVVIKDRQRFVLLGLIGLAALGFYPLALGAGASDPYHLGYGNTTLVAVLLLLALAAWLTGYFMITLCVALATLAWVVGWYESRNLWDYLIDPFISIYALYAVASQSVKPLRKRRSGTPGLS